MFFINVNYLFFIIVVILALYESENKIPLMMLSHNPRSYTFCSFHRDYHVISPLITLRIWGSW